MIEVMLSAISGMILGVIFVLVTVFALGVLAAIAILAVLIVKELFFG